MDIKGCSDLEFTKTYCSKIYSCSLHAAVGYIHVKSLEYRQGSIRPMSSLNLHSSLFIDLFHACHLLNAQIIAEAFNA